MARLLTVAARADGAEQSCRGRLWDLDHMAEAVEVAGERAAALPMELGR